jgi:predicted Zn-dependent protease
MRKIIIVIVCCVALMLAGYAGYQTYKVRKENHLISLARQFLAESDVQNTMLCLQLVLRSNPNDVEAVRLMADLYDSVHSPNALPWRNRVVELNPDSLDDRLSLAQTAILLGDYALATNTLAAVSVDGKNTAAYQNVAGNVAEAANQLSDAEAHFLQAARLEPDNQAIQLNLAVVRLRGGNASMLADARAVLTRISAESDNPALRCQALRELIGDAGRYKQNEAALVLSKELVEQTNSTFSDKLLRLEVLYRAGNAEFNSHLSSVQREVTNSPAGIEQLAGWQMANTSLDSTLAWLRSLPPDVQTNQPATMLISECLVLRQDGHGLQIWLEKQNWAELEFVRHAFLARALRDQNLFATSDSEWDQALQLANGVKSSLVTLLRLAAQWNWESKGEDILWAIVNQYPGEQWANHALEQILFTSGRTRPLMMLYSQQLKQSPSDLSIKNNLAMLALLLDAQELNPYELAHEVYESAPDNPVYASTYAFSLHLQNKDVEALKIMQQLKPQELQDPSTAGYYGIILKATGNTAEAKAYLDLTSKATLLPEERRLFERAKSGA